MGLACLLTYFQVIKGLCSDSATESPAGGMGQAGQQQVTHLNQTHSKRGSTESLYYVDYAFDIWNK